MKPVLALLAILVCALPAAAQDAGGDTCGTATGIPCPLCPNINFTDTGNTTGAVNDVGSIPAACPGGTFTAVSGPDHIYAFSVGPLGTSSLTITVTPIAPDAAWDPAIYVLGTCGTTSSCLAKADANGVGLAESISAGVFYPPGPHALYIDSAFAAPAAAAAGDYQVNVTGVIPVELIGFQVE